MGIVPTRLDQRRGTVLLVHGLSGCRAMMWPLARRLRQRGYDTVTWGYPSNFAGIEHHSQRLEQRLRELDQQAFQAPLHLVVHSMGGLLTRAALDRFRPRDLGRVVMLGTPNHGSHVARRLAPWFSWACRPLHELSDGAESLVHRLPEPVGVEVGVIAGLRDRVVRLEATRLPGLLDHCSVPSGHGELLLRRDVVERVDRFLRHGDFLVPAPAAAVGEKRSVLKGKLRAHRATS